MYLSYSSLPGPLSSNVRINDYVFKLTRDKLFCSVNGLALYSTVTLSDPVCFSSEMVSRLGRDDNSSSSRNYFDLPKYEWLSFVCHRLLTVFFQYFRFGSTRGPFYTFSLLFISALKLPPSPLRVCYAWVYMGPKPGRSVSSTHRWLRSAGFS